MITAIKRLIGSIDQLVLWLHENPEIPMPAQEKKRVIAILNMIMKTEVISDEKWKELKPQQPPLSLNNYKLNVWPFKKKAITIPKTIEEINRIKRGMVQCPVCKCDLLINNLEKHKKRCNPSLQKFSTTNVTRLQNSKSISFPVQFSTIKSQEIQSDGSYGYHQFRDNGKFGSYPSFDNMNDESIP